MSLAAEEDGGPDSKVPDSQQPNLCSIEQVPASQRLGQYAGGACPMLSASDATYAQLQHIVQSSQLPQRAIQPCYVGYQCYRIIIHNM